MQGTSTIKIIIPHKHIKYKVFQPCTVLNEPDSINKQMNESKGKPHRKTEYLWVQGNNSEYKDKHQGEDNEEQVESTVMSWRGEPVEQKARERECGNVTDNWDNQQCHVPAVVIRK